jgi:hypothetical protein
LLLSNKVPSPAWSLPVPQAMQIKQVSACSCENPRRF